MALDIQGLIRWNDHYWFVQITMEKKMVIVYSVAIVAAVIYMTNFKMAADDMFKQPKQLLLGECRTIKLIQTG